MAPRSRQTGWRWASLGNLFGGLSMLVAEVLALVLLVLVTWLLAAAILTVF